MGFKLLQGFVIVIQMFSPLPPTNIKVLLTTAFWSVLGGVVGRDARRQTSLGFLILRRYSFT